jgi:hypothetical protein
VPLAEAFSQTMAEDEKRHVGRSRPLRGTAADHGSPTARSGGQAAPVKVVISRVSKIDGVWGVEDAPLTFADGDPAYAHAVRWAKAWRAEDPENRCYVIEELPA